jgi:ectonucleotide pyrophosphatase/phosphodiesterase family protein 5
MSEISCVGRLTTCSMISFVIMFLIFIAVVMGVHEVPPSKVVLISFDGFRADYLDNEDLAPCTSNLRRLWERGLRTEYMEGSFVTKTFPSHYTIATGLYEESHGIVGNHMLDPLYPGEAFDVTNHDPKWWNDGEPIWVTAEQQNVRTATYYWPGSEVEIRGTRPSTWRPYDESVPYSDRVAEVRHYYQCVLTVSTSCCLY